ncbi:MAG: hypothetical protein AABX51_07925, partial [Nanoarchaeota archaeon]
TLIINVKGLGILHGKSAWWGLAVLVLRTIIEMIINAIIGFLLIFLIGAFITALIGAAISTASSGSLTLPGPLA